MGGSLRKVLVVYSTQSGCTGTIARRIGSDLIGHGVRPYVVGTDEMPKVLDGYSAVIFGSGMRMGHWHREARDWLGANAAILARVPLACYSVGLLAAGEGDSGKVQAERELSQAISAVHGINPVGSAVFPGWKQTEGFSTMEKLALKVYPLESGDYRDWDKVDAWVDQIAPLLLGDTEAK